MTTDSFHHFVEQERAIIGKKREDFFDLLRILKKNITYTEIMCHFLKKKLPKSKPNWTLSKAKIVMQPCKKPLYHNLLRRRNKPDPEIRQ